MISKGTYKLAILSALIAWTGTSGPVLADRSTESANVGDVAVTAGALLRESFRLQETAPNLAASRFLNIADRFPLIADYARQFRIEALMAANDLSDALVEVERFQRFHNASPIYPTIYLLEGDILGALGQQMRAQQAWQRALSATRSREKRAALEIRRAKSFETSGNSEEAIVTYRKLLATYGDLKQSNEAEVALSRLKNQFKRQLVVKHDWIERGEVLYRARDNLGALHAFDQALSYDLQPETRRQVSKQRGFTLFRLRRYSESREVFQSIRDDEETEFWYARSLARSGKIEDAIAQFERLGKGKSRRAVTSLFSAGLLLQGEGNLQAAIAHFKAVTKHGTLDQRASAHWRIGWISFLSDDFVTAVFHFNKVSDLIEDPLVKLRSRYWMARAAEESGDLSSAETFVQIATEFPLTYYGWRSSHRLENDIADPRSPELLQSGTSNIDLSKLKRIRTLVEAELFEEANSELQLATVGSLSLSDRLTLAGLYWDAGNIYRAQRLVLDAYALKLAGGQQAGLEALWRFAWPRAYAADRLHHRYGKRVPDELVLAVIREESSYRPGVTSPAGARGLLQIMPKTAQKLAADIGIELQDFDQLFDPAINVSLGTYYLGKLLSRFDGRVSAAVAGYNAGPALVKRWLRERPTSPDDVWVESIPYSETRSYVKRVLRSFHAYTVLYKLDS